MDENGDAESNYTLLDRKHHLLFPQEHGLYPVAVYTLKENDNKILVSKPTPSATIHGKMFIKKPTDWSINFLKPRGTYRGADKSLGRSGRKQARKNIRDAHNFNNFETRAVTKLFFLQGKAPKEIQAILTATLVHSLPGRAKDLSAPL